MARYQKILALLDLSADSEQVAAAARELAELYAAKLTLVHVVEYVPVEPIGEAIMPTVPIGDELLQRARLKLNELMARTKLSGAASRIEAGNIKAETLRVAEDEAADLIVLGSRERHGLAILVNLTEDTVLHAAHCDVLAVRLR
jgi:universal stress protein A